MIDVLRSALRRPGAGGVMTLAQLTSLPKAFETPYVEDTRAAIQCEHVDDQVIGIILGRLDRRFPAI